MDYEKKYKEMKARVLEMGRGYVKGLDYSKPRQIAEYIDPELKEESEDERIINRIKKAVENYWSDEPLNEILAWLEKQSQTFTKKDVDDAYFKGAADTKNEIAKQYEATYQIRKDIATFIFNYRGDIKDRAKWMNYLGIKVSIVEKQGELIGDTDTVDSNEDGLIAETMKYKREQKSAWSEEDEKMLDTVIEDIVKLAGPYICYHTDVEWLKSLKDRYTWKPSERQIYLLNWVANILLKDDGIVEKETAKELQQLLEQLKKL